LGTLINHTCIINVSEYEYERNRFSAALGTVNHRFTELLAQ